MVAIGAQMSTAAISAPSSAGRTAWLRPWPRAAPVMNATFPWTRPIALSLLSDVEARAPINILMYCSAIHRVDAEVASSPTNSSRSLAGNLARYQLPTRVILVAGVFGHFGQCNYASAKTVLIGLSNVLAIEGAKYDINSSVIAPIANTRLLGELAGPLADSLQPELVTPLVAYLASERCTLTHEISSVGGGRIARVFLGLTSGWMAGKGNRFTPEDVAAH